METTKKCIIRKEISFLMAISEYCHLFCENSNSSAFLYILKKTHELSILNVKDLAHIAEIKYSTASKWVRKESTPNKLIQQHVVKEISERILDKIAKLKKELEDGTE